ncbi:HAMP domain-containing histidine kinase [Brevibacillus composti]|uniref:histidine kinase n=1 Tax=Brevibacillus composti TaxID=2796470 RepID=A0A7T5JPN0_9BACL|nr:HAMP domain-containing sensor histidine kinase [Brevibacillus composti]QQE75449.1 HAMP domain-containing histidine kinase [Brevibacillus composti]QUO42475.1 HAMP domain-containing histidine kinase [Brevibacillus composti]
MVGQAERKPVPGHPFVDPAQFAERPLLAIILVYSLKDIPLETAVIRLESLSKFSIVAILAAVFYIYLLEFIRESILIRKQLVRAEKLKLISELAASVAHEVRNPLTVVRGFIQLMREDGNVTSREYMELVLSELDRAEYIISDYLSLAKPQAETSGKVGMAVTVTDVTALISSYAVIHKVEIQVNTEAGLYVCGNDVRIKQALLNLIKNAIESMPHGGILEIEARRSMDYVVIAIKDQGEGMTAAQIEKVGFPFYSTKEKGTGLGLMITSRIVEAMGGRLEFQSEAGKGTCVKVFLPAK